MTPSSATQCVTARAGEPLDALVWRVTGAGPAALPAVLEANPGLAAMGAALPEATPVFLPALPATSDALDIVQLWD